MLKVGAVLCLCLLSTLAGKGDNLMKILFWEFNCVVFLQLNEDLVISHKIGAMLM